MHVSRTLAAGWFRCGCLLLLLIGCADEVRIPMARNSSGIGPQRLVVAPTYRYSKLRRLGNAPQASGPSLARLGSKLLLCSYAELSEVDLQAGTIRQLSPPADVPRKQWKPTGVAVEEASGRIYIANYFSANVLVMRLRGGRLELVRTISSPDMRCPEGVAISPDGKRIAVADYYANALFLFTAEGKPLWRCRIDLCHGAAWDAASNTILATGLEERAVYRVDLAGNIVNSRGSLGWGRDEYLWPTSVAIDRQGRIIVADGQTGRISFLDKDLRVQKSVGGNGPGRDLFNMPYLAMPDGNQIIVCDVVKSRLMVLDAKTLTLQAAAGTGDDEPELFSAKPFGAGYIKYKDTAHTVTFAGQTWHPDYDSISNDEHRITFNNIRSLWKASNHYYFTQAANLADGRLLVGSPQSKEWLVCDDKEVRVLRLGENHWLVEDQIVGKQGGNIEEVALRQPIATIHQRLDKITEETQDITFHEPTQCQ